MKERDRRLFCIQPCTARFSRSTQAAALAAITVAVFLASPQPARAQPQPSGDQFRIAYTPKVFHFNDDPDYVDWNHIVALEWVTPRHVFWGADRTHFGLSFFDNSYGQFSQSVYAGLEWDWTRAFGGTVYGALSVGLIHGYKEPWEDKLPLNEALGVGLAVVPAIGWQRGALGFAASLTGNAVGFRLSYSFGR